MTAEAPRRIHSRPVEVRHAGKTRRFENVPPLAAYKQAALTREGDMENNPKVSVFAQDRGLWALLALAGVLAVAALLLAFHRAQTTHYRDDDSPQAVVYNYLLAIQRGDWEKAYALLDTPYKPTFADFKEGFVGRSYWPDVIHIGQAVVKGDRAEVPLEIRYDSGPWAFSEISPGGEDKVVLKRVHGQWKIRLLPPVVWPFPQNPPPTSPCEPSGGTK